MFNLQLAVILLRGYFNGLVLDTYSFPETVCQNEHGVGLYEYTN